MNTAVKQAILDKIKEYDRILIFRHKRVDGGDGRLGRQARCDGFWSVSVLAGR